MAGPAINFGFLEAATEVAWSAGCIEPLANHAQTVATIKDHERHYGGWFYPPAGPCQIDIRETKTGPAIATVFPLPATHQLRLSDGRHDEDAASFFIAFFGFLNGLRLQRDTWQHFMRCPTKRALCDFIAGSRDMVTALDTASKFWDSHPDAAIRKLAFGALHWHLFAQLYQHDFERFNAQYTAIDACWRLAVNLGQAPDMRDHARRPKCLAEALGIQVPQWAAPLPAPEKGCALSQQRNALIHEAMYAGEPVGFASPSFAADLTLELTGFVARCWLRLIGIDNEYTRSPVSTRQMMGFTF